LIRRLVYHCFWNFYDYLGTYSISGVALTALYLIAAEVCVWIFPGNPIFAALAFALPALAVSAAGVSLLVPFAAKAARGEPARYPDLIAGIRTQLVTALKFILVYFGFAAILAGNIAFYFLMGRRHAGSATGMIATSLGAALIWVFLAWWIAGFPAASCCDGVVRLTFRQWFRKSILLLALAPGVWISAAFMLALVIVLGALSRVGIVFILPCFACFSCTAAWIVGQHAELLDEARNQIGAGKKVGEYRRMAQQLGFEWEMRQPRRTFRELIKPWE